MPNLAQRLQLRHAGSGFQPRAAPASRPDSHLDSVDAQIRQEQRTLGCSDVAADQIGVAYPLRNDSTAARMTSECP